MYGNLCGSMQDVEKSCCEASNNIKHFKHIQLLAPPQILIVSVKPYRTVTFKRDGAMAIPFLGRGYFVPLEPGDRVPHGALKIPAGALFSPKCMVDERGVRTAISSSDFYTSSNGVELHNCYFCPDVVRLPSILYGSGLIVPNGMFLPDATICSSSSGQDVYYEYKLQSVEVSKDDVSLNVHAYDALFPDESVRTEYDTLKSELGSQVQYSVFALGVHSGTTIRGGHFLAYVRRSGTSWTCFNDSDVSLASFEEAVKYTAAQQQGPVMALLQPSNTNTARFAELLRSNVAIIDSMREAEKAAEAASAEKGASDATCRSRDEDVVSRESESRDTGHSADRSAPSKTKRPRGSGANPRASRHTDVQQPDSENERDSDSSSSSDSDDSSMSEGSTQDNRTDGRKVKQLHCGGGSVDIRAGSANAATGPPSGRRVTASGKKRYVHSKKLAASQASTASQEIEDNKKLQALSDELRLTPTQLQQATAAMASLSISVSRDSGFLCILCATPWLLVYVVLTQKGSTKLYKPKQVAFIQYLAKQNRTLKDAKENDVVEFLLLWSCDYNGKIFLINKQSKSAFATARSAVRKLFSINSIALPYNVELLRTVHRSIKLEAAKKYAVEQSPPLGCFDVRLMIASLFQVCCRQKRV